jgi:peptidoglycan/LPS O-acetylase OafA/YrhL
MSGKSSDLLSAKTPEEVRIFYINNLKILLTVLVVLHHSFITYGAPGSWYFTEKTVLKPALVVMTLFVASNQAFFMGFFFFLSGLFIEPSIDKKGARKFMMDRFKRLGIPLVFYSIVLSPSLNYLAEHYGKGEHRSFLEYMSGYSHWIDFGVLWFVAALLIFSLLFVFLKTNLSLHAVSRFPLPGDKSMLVFALILGLISYWVRGYFPIGWTLKPLGFQLGHFPQYGFLFMAGILASRNKWLEGITYQQGLRWMGLAFIFMIIVFPLLYLIKIQTNSSDASFRGNFAWQSLVAAEWEQITGISLIVGLLGIARRRWNGQTAFESTLARASYGVYIFHPVVLIALALLVQAISVEPLFKLLFVAPLAVILTFALAGALIKTPFVRQVI